MPCFCCPMKTFVATWTIITAVTYPLFLYFIFRDFSLPPGLKAFHVLSIISALVGVASYGFILRCWYLKSYDCWRVAILNTFVFSCFVAFFELNGVMMGATIGVLVVSGLFVIIIGKKEEDQLAREAVSHILHSSVQDVAEEGR